LSAPVTVSPAHIVVPEELFVLRHDKIEAYDRTATGDAAPIRTVLGPNTGLFDTAGIAVDVPNGELLAVNSSLKSITVYPRTANGDAAPIRKLSGAATGLEFPTGVVVDTEHAELLVANNAGNSITVYSRTASGNVAPLRILTGAGTGLNSPRDLALDPEHDELVVTNTDGSGPNNSFITVYDRAASGNTGPKRTLSGPDTELDNPLGVAVDAVHDELVVTNYNSNVITVYPRTASGNTAPIRTLSGPETGLGSPIGLVLDVVNDELVVANGEGGVTVYPISAGGDAAPVRELNLVQEFDVAVTTDAADADDDGVPDSADNCLAVANPDQRDTNGDGIGNVCDADLDDDCAVNFLDLGLLKIVFFSADPDADFNGDGSVNFADLGIMKGGFFLPPGPSGVPNACDGAKSSG
jgi:6-phosphogluconolactonase (cycloisomerase 2 family)